MPEPIHVIRIRDDVNPLFLLRWLRDNGFEREKDYACIFSSVSNRNRLVMFYVDNDKVVEFKLMFG